jgi:hypothetical protein
LEYFLDIFHRDHDCFEVLNWSYIRLFSLAEMVRMSRKYSKVLAPPLSKYGSIRQGTTLIFE